MDLFDFVNLAADMGLDAVEPTSYYFPPDVDADYLHRLKQHAFLLGPGHLGHGDRQQLLPPARARSATSSSRCVRTWIDRAAELDAPVIRIFAGNVPKGDDRGAGGRLGHRGDQGVAALRGREGGDAGPGEPRRDHGDARPDPEAGQGGRRARTSA